MNLNFKIGIGQKNDFDAIIKMQIDNAIYHADLDAKYVLKNDIEHNFSQNLERYFSNDKCKILVAKSSENIVGFVLGYSIGNHPIFDFPKRAFIDEIFIPKKYRKNGIGKALIEAFLKEMKVEELVLKVNAKNRDAIQFWEKMGFATELLQMKKMKE